mmetsp:Transcript_58604/g.121090  ORF Transcript_58604/g.121090 Transcript_58604/m.121090 type:complete len:88 (+) Transcript_58604:642-905(+)
MPPSIEFRISCRKPHPTGQEAPSAHPFREPEAEGKSKEGQVAQSKSAAHAFKPSVWVGWGLRLQAFGRRLPQVQQLLLHINPQLADC